MTNDEVQVLPYQHRHSKTLLVLESQSVRLRMASGLSGLMEEIRWQYLLPFRRPAGSHWKETAHAWLK